MSRIIQLNGTGKQRELLVRSIVLTLRELATSTEVSASTRDQAAYISLALQAIYDSIDLTVVAWEKRGYWLKADRFRMEWAWTGQTAEQLKQVLFLDDWAGVASACARISTRFDSTTLPKRTHLGTPWVGAWEKLSSSPQNKPN